MNALPLIDSVVSCPAETRLKSHGLLCSHFPKFPAFMCWNSDPYSNGYQYGSQCAGAIQTAVGLEKNSCWGWGDLSSPDEFEARCIAALEKLDRNYVEEIRGIAAGAAVKMYEVLYLTCLPDVRIMHKQIPRERVKPATGCTMVVVLEEDNIIVGNNIDNPPLHQLVYSNVPGEMKYIFCPYIGRNYGGGPGMNEAGLCTAAVSISPANGYGESVKFVEKYSPQKKPDDFFCGYSLWRDALRVCRNVQDVKEFLKGKITTFRSTGVAFTDVQGNGIVVSATPGYMNIMDISRRETTWPNIVQDGQYIQDVLGMSLQEYLRIPDPITGSTRAKRKKWLDENDWLKGIPGRAETIYGVMRNPDGLLVEHTTVTAVFEPMKRRMLASFGAGLKADVYELFLK